MSAPKVVANDSNGKRPASNYKLPSFASVSSSESVLEGRDTVDAVPQRMPLFESDYIKKRQASVDNLIANIPLYGSLSKRKRTYGDTKIDAKEGGQLLSAESANGHGTRNSYFEVGEQLPDDGYKARSKTLPTYSRRVNTALRGQYGLRVPEMNFTETDLGPMRLPRPSLKDVKDPEPCPNGDTPVIDDKSPEQEAPSEETSLPDNDCCNNTPWKVWRAMWVWKYMFTRFSAWDFCQALFAIGIYIFDVVTDLLLALWYFYYRDSDEDYILFFRLTLGFVIGPSLVVQIFSYIWVLDDSRIKRERKNGGSNTRCCDISAADLVNLIVIAVLHVFQLATFFRYARALLYGFKSRYYEVKKEEARRKHFDLLWKCEVHDVNFLRLLESFLESAPQLVLQIYVMLTKGVEIINVVSCVGSLVGLSSAMVSIQRAIRNTNENKGQLTIPATIVMFIWRAFTISSRVLAFALFLMVQPLAFLIFVVLHWLGAFLWIAYKGTNFCTKKRAEVFFDAIIGVVYTFCFFNVHEPKDGGQSRSRWRMLVFYIIILVENTTVSFIWYYFRDTTDSYYLASTNNNPMQPIQVTTGADTSTGYDELLPIPVALTLLITVPVFFLIGMCVMLLYYACFHPRKNELDWCDCFKRKRSGDSPTELVSAAMPATSQFNSEGVEYAHNSTRIPNSSSEAEHQRSMLASHGSHNKMAEFYVAMNSAKDNPHMNWSDVIFNRERRAEQLYTRQYSKEKLTSNAKIAANSKGRLDHGDDAGSSHANSAPTARQPDDVITKRMKFLNNPPASRSWGSTSNNCTSSAQGESSEGIAANKKPASFATNRSLPTHSGSCDCKHEVPTYSKKRSYSASTSCLADNTSRQSGRGKQRAYLTLDKRLSRDKHDLKSCSAKLRDDEFLVCMETTV